MTLPVGEIICGDSLEVMRGWPADSVDCCVTSPPYWGLRDYGVDGQLGLERTPQEYIAAMVAVFEEVRRVLKPTGTLWLNVGDSYSSSSSNNGGFSDKSTLAGFTSANVKGRRQNDAGESRPLNSGLKPKDLCMIPARLALALQDAGWWLRSDIIWAKPNPMPESVTDRPTSAHEHIFLLAKAERYYYDAEAIAEPVAVSTLDRIEQDVEGQIGSERANGGAKTNGNMKAVIKGAAFGAAKGGFDDAFAGSRLRSGNEYQPKRKAGPNAFRGQGSNREYGSGPANREGRDLSEIGNGLTRNSRNVWEIATRPFKQAHFATFPPELPRRCILAGCPMGGVVLDPFFGSGTVGMVAQQLARQFIGIELNPDYCAIARKRTAQKGLALEVTA